MYRLVRLGSPYVNVMIIAGAAVFYLMVILFGVDENVASDSTVDGLCHARIWLVAIGFSLLYGTIFAKTWRIYYIFNHSKPNSKFVSEHIYMYIHYHYLSGSQRHIFIWDCWNTCADRYRFSDTTHCNLKC